MLKAKSKKIGQLADDTAKIPGSVRMLYQMVGGCFLEARFS